MFKLLAAALLLSCAAGAAAQAVPAGQWDVSSTVVDLSVPGMPGFLQRMVRGKSRAEHKRLLAGQGVEALLEPDPKAHCRVDSQRIENGQYSQALTCPQRRGEPMHIARSGTYDAAGFIGRAAVSGATTKGALRIVLAQRAVRVRD